MRSIRHTASAEADLRAIFEWTVRHFGMDGLGRYRRLVGQALRDLAEDPGRIGVREVAGEFNIYHLRHSREQVPEIGQRVHRPRHLILFRATPGRVEILRYLHDSMDLERHVAEEDYEAGP